MHIIDTHNPTRTRLRREAAIRAANVRLIRVSGEVVSVEQAMARTGLSRRQVLDRYRWGRKTWDGLVGAPMRSQGHSDEEDQV